MRSRTRGKGVGRAVPALLLCGVLPGCTIVKPVVGVVTGPFLIFGECGRGWGGGSGTGYDGPDALSLLIALGGIGATCGLVTGAISDVQVLTGEAAQDPAANWWNPYRTNTDR